MSGVTSFLSGGVAYYLSAAANYLFEPDFKQCHGSTFGALYLMGRLKDQNRNSLVPYGQLERLKIPVFSGECFRGIADNGVNRDKTSWASISDCSLSVSYSKKFPFSIDQAKEYLLQIVKDNERPGRNPPFATTEHSAYWNKILLRIRQVRAWDEQEYQQGLKEGLVRWIDAEIAFRLSPIFRRDFDNLHYKRLQEVRNEIEGPVYFQLSAKDKEMILKTFPIVFLRCSGDTDFHYSGEFGIEGNLSLGEDIQGIATPSEFVEEVKQYLYQQGLSSRVKVISFAALALEKLSHTV